MLLLVVLVSGLAVAAGACDVNTNGGQPVSVKSPISSPMFTNSYSSAALPFQSFYSTQIDLVNGFKAQFDTTSIFPSPVSNGAANAGSYPSILLELAAGLPGMSSGPTIAVTISPAGVIVINGTTKVLTTTLTQQQSFFLTYDRATLSVAIGNAANVVSSIALLPYYFSQGIGGGNIGYIGLVTTIDPFVTNPWTSFSFDGFTLTTIPFDETKSKASVVGNPATTVVAGTTITYSVTLVDKCGNQLYSPALVSSVSGFFTTNGIPNVIAGKTGTVTAESGTFKVAIQATKSGVMDTSIQIAGANILGYPVAKSFTVNPGVLVGSSTTLSDFKSPVLKSDGPAYVYTVTSFDILGNVVPLAQSSNSPYSVTLTDQQANVIAGGVVVNWNAATSTFQATATVAQTGTYSIHLYYQNVEVPSSPYVLTVVTVIGDTVTQKDYTVAIVAGVIGLIILVLGIYGGWRGLRYRQKHREAKKKADEAAHANKVARAEAERNKAERENAMVLNDQGGYVTEQQVRAAQDQADKQEAMANIISHENEKIEIQISIAREKIQLLKAEKQKGEIKGTDIKVAKAAKKRQEFGQVAS